MAILAGIGVDCWDRRLIVRLSTGQTAAVRANDDVSKPNEIQRGVHRGCLISPMLFNIYAEAIVKEALDNLDVGVKIGGVLVKAVLLMKATLQQTSNLLMRSKTYFIQVY